MRVDGTSSRGLWPPVGGRLCRRVVKEKVLRIDRPNGRRVLKFDGLSGRGLWWRLRRRFYKKGARLAPQVVQKSCVRFAQGATAALPPRVADCRSAAMLIKSALRDLLSVSYGMISILRIGSLRSPPPFPAAPDFPRKRGQNKALKSSPFISSSQHNGAL